MKPLAKVEIASFSFDLYFLDIAASALAGVAAHAISNMDKLFRWSIYKEMEWVSLTRSTLRAGRAVARQPRPLSRF